MEEWISVKECFPKNDGKYLCFDGRFIRLLYFAKNLFSVDEFDFLGEQRSGFYDYSSEWGYHEWSCITHWMPMPLPPMEYVEQYLKGGADND